MKLLIKLLFIIASVLLVSCNSTDNSTLENTINELKENQNNIQEQIVRIKDLQDNQVLILKKIQTIEKSLANLALASKNKPANNQRPKEDPNKVYSVTIGNSFVQGNNNAKVTIIEWADYF